MGGGVVLLTPMVASAKGPADTAVGVNTGRREVLPVIVTAACHHQAGDAELGRAHLHLGRIEHDLWNRRNRVVGARRFDEGAVGIDDGLLHPSRGDYSQARLVTASVPAQIDPLAADTL